VVEVRNAPAESSQPGTEPDARFTFANERTFLAWNRTALALIAAGLAIVQLLPPFAGVPWGRHMIAVPLIVAGGMWYHRSVFSAVATYLGLSQAALRSQLQAGMPLSKIAKIEGKTMSRLRAAMLAAMTNRFDAIDGPASDGIPMPMMWR